MVVHNSHGQAQATSQTARIASESGIATWEVAEEVPTAFVYNGRNYAVMLATPDDLLDYAVGFSLAEKIVIAVDEILSISIEKHNKGINLKLIIDELRQERLNVIQRRRNLTGRAGCGLCGIENADTFIMKLPSTGAEPAICDLEAVNRAANKFRSTQPLNQVTRSVHAAAWASMNGQIELVREDVGRHNALDKLIGAMALANIDPKKGFLLMSSRCSYELVEKAARFGIRILASVSAPTAFAIRKAEEANITLIARNDKTFVFVGRK